MTDSPAPDESAPTPVRLPEAAKASLREFLDTQNPKAFEAFIGEMVEVTEEYAHHHSGPLPTPEALAQYESVLPGLAERIVRLAEGPGQEVAREQTHRHAIEAKVVKHTSGYRTTGLWMGFCVASAALAAALYCAVIGQWGVAVGFLSLPLVGVISVLVTGKPWAGARPKAEGGSENIPTDTK